MLNYIRYTLIASLVIIGAVVFSSCSSQYTYPDDLDSSSYNTPADMDGQRGTSTLDDKVKPNPNKPDKPQDHPGAPENHINNGKKPEKHPGAGEKKK